MTGKIAALAAGLVVLMSLGGMSRADDFIGCIGEYRGPHGWAGGCSGNLQALHLLPKPAYWRDCNFAQTKPIFPTSTRCVIFALASTWSSLGKYSGSTTAAVTPADTLSIV
jgi:hypothetical protein